MGDLEFKIQAETKNEHKYITINNEKFQLINCNHVDRDGAYYSVDTQRKVILTNMKDTEEVLKKVKMQYNSEPFDQYF